MLGADLKQETLIIMDDDVDFLKEVDAYHVGTVSFLFLKNILRSHRSASNWIAPN